MSGWQRWLVVLLGLLTIACSPVASDRAALPEAPPAVAEATPAEISAAAIEAIKAGLAEQVGMSPDDLRLEQAEAVDWPDACLGLAQPDEICAQMVTPGFRAKFAAPQSRYQVHSDRSGRSIRLAP